MEKEETKKTKAGDFEKSTPPDKDPRGLESRLGQTNGDTSRQGVGIWRSFWAGAKSPSDHRVLEYSQVLSGRVTVTWRRKGGGGG